MSLNLYQIIQTLQIYAIRYEFEHNSLWGANNEQEMYKPYTMISRVNAETWE